MKLDDYKKCFDLSFDQFITKRNISDNQVEGNVRYEKITNAYRIDLADSQYFFFKEGTLKMIYISDSSLVENLWREFKSIPDTIPEDTVRSRAGKTSNQVIFSAHGIAASIGNNDVDFIEIYPPCSLEDYLENIYQEPRPFIR